jgi:hypothetical protein
MPEIPPNDTLYIMVVSVLGLTPVALVITAMLMSR